MFARAQARVRTAVLVVLAAWVVPCAARAEDARAGKQHFRRGQMLLDAGDYRAAARAFEAGFSVAPRPGFLLNIGNCHRKLGELGKARSYYWRFLDSAGKQHPARAEVISYLRIIEQIHADGVALDEPAATGVVPSLAWPPPRHALHDRSATHDEAPKPLYKKWWFWTAVGGVVAVSAIALSQ